MAKRGSRTTRPAAKKGTANKGASKKGTSTKGSAGRGSASKGSARGPAKGASKGTSKSKGPAKGPVKSAGSKPKAKPYAVKKRPSNDSVDSRRKPKRSTAINQPPREEGERLQKLLAAAGVASRRECELLIQEGRVEVDGEVVTELGRRVDPFQAKITFDGESLPKHKRLYFAVNKPDGVVCTARDPSGRPRVTDLLPPDVGRVFNVGRLDMASEGLILLTNDGELANQLTHPRHGVEKIYNVQVAGVPTPETLSELRRGVYLAEGKAHFVNGRVKSRRKGGAILEVILDEGRNREIRRVLARVGHKVQRLTRIAVGPVRLGELPSGAYRPLTPEEVRALKNAVKTGSEKADEASSPADTKRTKRGKPSSSRTGKPGAKPGARQSKPADQAAPQASGRRVIGAESSTPSPSESRSAPRKKPAKAGYRSKSASSTKRPHRKK